jgi:hypothetical protein
MKRVTILVAALLLLCASATAAEPRHDIHFPDIPGCHTLKCDFHTHTVFSDGNVWPTVRIDEAWREGLDAIALTDHIEYQPHREDVPTNHSRPCELAAGRARELGILLIRGAEITRDTPPGHHNAIFLDDIDRLAKEDFFAVFDTAQKQGAFVFWNHPGWQGLEAGKWGEAQQTLLDKKQLHGIEICNGDSYYEYAHQLALDKGLTLVGNSDIHDPSPELQPTPEHHRTLTLVFARERNLESLHDALRAGRTAVWQKNRLIGNENELSAMFSACVRVNPPHHRSGNRMWVAIDNRGELEIELERIDETVRPARFVLAPLATTLVRFEASPELRAQGLPYRTANFLTGPAKPLNVKLVIPGD